MQTTNLRKLNFGLIHPDPKSFLKRSVRADDFKHLITESSIVQMENSKPVVYLDLNLPEITSLWSSLSELKFNASNRYKGVANLQSILFGAISPQVNKSNFCSFGALRNRNMMLEKAFIRIAQLLNELMSAYLPGYQKVNTNLIEKTQIHDDYFIEDTFWTSGILNKNSAQPYHFDLLNQPHMFSAMFTLKKRMSGGYLVFPQYELAFEVKNGSVIFFCGRDILHGVSPMRIQTGGARYTTVYYTTAGLKNCDSYEQEKIKALM